MKKIKLLVLLCALSVSSFSQTKIANVSFQEILLEMPAVKKLQKDIDSYLEKEQIVIDNMWGELESKKQEHNAKWDSYDDPKKQNANIDLQQMEQRIGLYGQNVKQQAEKKQMEGLEPIQNSIEEAIKNVAKEGGYTYIIESGVLHYSDKNSDVTSLVKKKLGL